MLFRAHRRYRLFRHGSRHARCCACVSLDGRAGPLAGGCRVGVVAIWRRTVPAKCDRRLCDVLGVVGIADHHDGALAACAVDCAAGCVGAAIVWAGGRCLVDGRRRGGLWKHLVVRDAVDESIFRGDFPGAKICMAGATRPFRGGSDGYGP